MDGARDLGQQTSSQGPLETPEKKRDYTMTFLPKAFRIQELMGLAAAIPAAVLGSAFFLYLLDVGHRLTA